jgi:hypothetical protein
MTEANGQAETSTTAPTTTVVTGQGSPGDDVIKVAGPLSADNRAAIEAKKWLKEDGSYDANTALDAYRNLESEFSKSIRTPGETATADEWNAFYSKMGRPETADKYELKLDASTVPEGFPYDEKSAIEFRNWAHEAGLNPKQAQTLHDKYIAHQAGGFTQSVAAVGQKADAAHLAIVGKWGSAESDGYKQNVELMSRSVNELGLSKAFAETGVLSPSGEILNADIAFALAKIGKELYAEDKMTTNAGGSLNNPWADGEKLNRTLQGQILRDDPAKAKQLIRAAGKDPAQWGL